MTVTIGFVGFWPGFDSEDFFLPILRAVYEEDVIEATSHGVPDLVLRSVFIRQGRSHPVMRAVRRIPQFLERAFRAPQDDSRNAPKELWFTGENVRPPQSGYSATLSFDPTGGNNFRVPLWWLLFPAPGSRKSETSESRRLGMQPSLTEALNGRSLTEPGSRPKFACTFIGKPEATRLSMIEVLERIGRVETFGTYFGNPVDHKFPIASDYDFVICPENSTYPGYITEKAIEAWASGAIPLYLGNDVHGDLNPGALVNLHDYANTDDFCAVVEELTSDPIKIESMRKRNILNRAPDYEGLVDFLRAALG
jgi:hypothetical protein